MKKTRLETATLYALFGILATVILGIPGVYFAIHEKRPHISYEIIGDSKVLDVHQPVKELEIRYRGEDIYAQKKNLNVLTVTIQNDGETHIRQADFDASLPWGLQLTSGQLVDIPKLVSFNSDYIHNNINIQATTNNFISFQKIIFERGKYFTFELQVLHRDDEEPRLQVVGKIAGIESQAVIENRKDNGVPGFWSSVFYGSVTVQFVRVGIFMLSIIALLIAIVATAISLQDKTRVWRTKKTKRKIEKYLVPILNGKEEKEALYLERLLVFSGGNVPFLEDALKFLVDQQKVGLFLSSRGQRIRRPQNLPPLLAMDTHVMMYDADGPQFSVFAYKASAREEFTLYENTITLLSELIAFLKADAMPTRLQKRLNRLAWWEIEEPKPGLTVTRTPVVPN